MRKLEVNNPEVNLEEILQKYADLEELEVLVKDNYPVSDEHEANATIHQLKVLKIELRTKDEKIKEKLISSILKQNNLHQFYFNSNICSLSQSLGKQLAAHVCQLKRMTILHIFDEQLLKEVEVIVAKSRVVWITRLEKFGCQLRYFKSLSSSFLSHFTNLRKLDIDCHDAEETKVKDLISFMNKSQLTSIKLWLTSAKFQLLQQLQVDSLQLLVIQINNKRDDKVPVFEILQEFLPRHPKITQFEIKFWRDYDEPKSLELIPMFLATLTKLERLKVFDCPKLTADVINQIAKLETLKSWKINDHNSKTFYKA